MGSIMVKKAEDQEQVIDKDEETLENEELDLESEDEGKEPENKENQDDETKNQGDEDESVIVTIGEEAPPHEDESASAPEWVRELRKSHRDLQKENRELKAKLDTSSKPEKATLGTKPTLESCDYDTDKYDAALGKWYEDKRKVEEEANKVKAEEEAQQREWEGNLTAYAKEKSELKVKDFDEAEAAAQEILSPVQQGIILQGAKKRALVIYALGKNEKKAKELAAIKDPVKFAFAVAELEAQLKVTSRKAPPPEKTVQGSGRVSGAVDSTLERLRAEAEKTGNFTKVHQYKKQLKAKAG